MFSFIAYFKSVLGNAYDKSVTDRGLKIDTTLVPCEDQRGRTREVSSVTFSGMGLTNLDDLQRPPQCVDLNLRSGSDLIVIKVAITHKDSFSIPYPFELICSLMDGVLQTLVMISKYCFCI